MTTAVDFSESLLEMFDILPKCSYDDECSKVAKFIGRSFDVPCCGSNTIFFICDPHHSNVVNNWFNNRNYCCSNCKALFFTSYHAMGTKIEKL